MKGKRNRCITNWSMKRFPESVIAVQECIVERKGLSPFRYRLIKETLAITPGIQYWGSVGLSCESVVDMIETGRLQIASFVPNIAYPQRYVAY